MKEKLLIELFETFAEKEVRPLAKEIDELERFPEETVKKMAELGMMGLPYASHEGSNAGYKAYIDAVRILSKSCATTGVILSAHTSLCASPIYHFGTEEKKQTYLTKLKKGTS